MLGPANMYEKSSSSQRRRIDILPNSEIDKMIKEEKRKAHLISLANKYFNNIKDAASLLREVVGVNG